MLVHAEFHNGVAAGLRLAPDLGTVTSTWIAYNQPKKDQAASLNAHAGFLLALGLQGHLVRTTRGGEGRGGEGVDDMGHVAQSGEARGAAVPQPAARGHQCGAAGGAGSQPPRHNGPHHGPPADHPRPLHAACRLG